MEMEFSLEKLHLTDVFVCDECANVYTEKEELDEHLKKHKSEGVVPETSSASSAELELKEEKPELCDICGKLKREQMSEQMIPIKTEKSSEESSKDMHELEPNFYVCAECKNVFKMEEELDEHLKQHNSGEDVQERSFPDSKVCPEMELKEDKPELCEDCGKVKPKEKFFICADCRTVFTAEKELDEHQKTHNCGQVVRKKPVPNSTLELKEKKPELCQNCGKVKPKPELYACSECTTVFAAEGELNRHFKMQNSEGKVPESPESGAKDMDEVNEVCSSDAISCEKQDEFTQAELNEHLNNSSLREVIPETEMELKEELCEVCGKAFTTTDGLNRINEERPHTCDCDKQKPERKFFVCADCEAVFTVEEKLDEHLKTRRFEQSTSVSPQSASSDQPSPVEGHSSFLTGEDESPEKLETSYHVHAEELEFHMTEDPEVDVTTVDVKPYVCDMCSEACENLKNFLHHQKTLCPERSKDQTQTHNKLYVCDLCFEIFTDKNSLVSHKKQHGFPDREDTITESVEADTKPYVCKICHEAFSDLNSLTSHKEQHVFPDHEDAITERIETDTKPYLCDMCKEAFKTLNGFLHHKVTLCPEVSRTLTETDTKPHLCDLCPEIFTDKEQLVSHEKQHGFPESEDPITEPDVNSLASHKEQQHGFPSEAKTNLKPETSDSSSTSHSILGSISFDSEGLFICVHCKNIFDTEEALNHHLKTHRIARDVPDVTTVRLANQKESTSTALQTCKHKEETSQPDGCIPCEQLIDSCKFPKPQQCKLCDKSFTERRSFNVHMLTHRSKRHFLDRTTSTGHNCENIFEAEETLNNHLHIQSSTEVNADVTPVISDQHDIDSTGTALERKTYQCKKCKETFELKPEYTKHLRRHGFIYDCSQCGEVLTQNGQLTFNLAVKTWERSYHCEHCGKTFALKGKLNVQANNLLKSYLYDQSGKTSSEKNSSGSHLSTQTENTIQEQERIDSRVEIDNICSEIQAHGKSESTEESYLCDKCNKVFLTNDNLTDHLFAHKDIPYRCGQCCKAFTLETEYTKHLSSHGPFHCSLCSKTFENTDELTLHFRAHEGKKPLYCDKCNKITFTEKRNLTISEILSGVKRFQCDQCHKSFMRNDHLRNRLRASSRENPFQCDQCDKKYTAKSSLMTHHGRHHSVSGEKPFEHGQLVQNASKDDLTKLVGCDCFGKNTAVPEQILLEESMNQEMIKESNAQELKRREETHQPDKCISTEPKIDKCSLSETNISEAAKNNVSKYINKVLSVCPHCQILFVKEDLVRHLQEHNAAGTKTEKVEHPEDKTFSKLERHIDTNQLKKTHQLDGHISTEQNIDKCRSSEIKISKTSCTQISTEDLTKNQTFVPVFHVCPHCQRLFISEEYLKRHLEEHNTTGTKTNIPGHPASIACAELICDGEEKNQCDKPFPVQQHIDENLYQCKLCGDTFLQRTSLDAHMLTHTRKKYYLCKLCNKTFARKTIFKVHMLMHPRKNAHMLTHDEGSTIGRPLENNLLPYKPRTPCTNKPYQCDQCGQRFLHEITLAGHIRKHAGLTPYQCDKCEKVFLYITELISHRREHISIYKPNKCCNAFSEKINLTRHNTTHAKQFKCAQCDKAFIRKDSLIWHSRIHNKEGKTFTELKCEKETTNKSDEALPVQQHIDKNLHRCELCGNTFLQRTSLDAHMLTHRRSESHYLLLLGYRCDQCDKVLAQKGDLILDVPGATWQKLFHCDRCDKTFFETGTLTVLTGNILKLLQYDQCGRTDSEKSSLTSRLSDYTENNTPEIRRTDSIVETDHSYSRIQADDAKETHTYSIDCEPTIMTVKETSRENYKYNLCQRTKNSDIKQALIPEEIDCEDSRMKNGETDKELDLGTKGSSSCEPLKAPYSGDKTLTELECEEETNQPEDVNERGNKNHQYNICDATFTHEDNLDSGGEQTGFPEELDCDNPNTETSEKHKGPNFGNTGSSVCGLLEYSGGRKFTNGEYERETNQPDQSTSFFHRDQLKKRHQCKLCSKSFAERKNFNAHMLIHRSKKPYQCEKCKKCFTLRNHLKIHMKTEHLYKAVLVKSKYPSDNIVIRITRIKKPHRCNKCVKAFRLKNHLIRHLRIHSAEKPFQCDQCGKGFAVKCNLTTHLRTHGREKPFQCVPGEKAFTQRTHIREKPFICDQCGKAFRHKFVLTNHLRTHSGEKPFQCVQCDKAFAVKCNLITHLRTHSGEKPFRCAQCGKKFAQKYSLTLHRRRHRRKDKLSVDLRTHNVDKPKDYQCGHCGKSFLSETTLIGHLRKQSRLNPYQCDQCDQEFSLKNDFTLHLRAHFLQGNRYRCYKCDKRFSSKFFLDMHNRIHTKQRISCRRLQRESTFTGHHSEPGDYQCLQCYKEFSYENEIIAHLIAHFLKGNRYGYNKRDERFSNEFFPKMHKRTRTKQRASHRSLRGEATGPFRKHPRGKPYQCVQCNKAFSRKFFLEMHIKRTHTKQRSLPRKTTSTGHHSEPGQYQCLQCNKGFTFESEIIAHLGAHFHQANRYRCNKCDKRFSSEFFFKMHKRFHTKHRTLRKHPIGKLYQCEKCGKAFVRESLLDDHIKRTHNKQRRLATENSITDPLRRPYKCDQCDIAFGRKSNLTTHLRAHFLKNNPYQCDQCDEAFKCKNNLATHLRTHFLKDNPNQCDQCNKAFKSKSKLNAHLRAHFLKDNPYRCSKCEQAFSKKVNLILHKRTRHFKRFQCDLCDRRFAERHGLNIHKTAHARNKARARNRGYQCDNCDKVFAQKHELLIHRGSHNEDKPFPYECDQCDQKFGRKCTFVIHLRMHMAQKP